MMEMEVNGKTHILVPKDVWDEIWDVFNPIEQIGE